MTAALTADSRRLLTALAAHRLAERRLLSLATLVSECLPARSRVGVAPDTSVHDLLADPDPSAEALLGRCLEAVTGVPLPQVVDREVIVPAGLAGTSLHPPPRTTVEDLARLQQLLAQHLQHSTQLARTAPTTEGDLP